MRYWFAICLTLVACDSPLPVTYPWILPMTVDIDAHVRLHYCQCYGNCGTPIVLDADKRSCLESIHMPISPTLRIFYCELYVQAGLYNCLQSCSVEHDRVCEDQAATDQIYCDSICHDCTSTYDAVQVQVDACLN